MVNQYIMMNKQGNTIKFFSLRISTQETINILFHHVFLVRLQFL